jgi:hypothetical protein
MDGNQSGPVPPEPAAQGDEGEIDEVEDDDGIGQETGGHGATLPNLRTPFA